MKDAFRLLLSLQAADLEAERLQRRLGYLEGGGPLVESEQQLQTLAAALTQRTAAMQRAEREAQRQEAEAHELRAERERLEKRLYGGEITSAKEAEKLQARLRQLAEAADEHELAALGAMERVEKLAPEIERLRHRHERLETGLIRRRAEVETEIKHVQQQIAAVETTIAAARAAVPEPVLRKYDFHRQRRGGQVVAEISAGRCGACEVTLPVAVVTRVKKMAETAADKWYVCENCGRLLIWLGDA